MEYRKLYHNIVNNTELMNWLIDDILMVNKVNNIYKLYINRWVRILLIADNNNDKIKSKSLVKWAVQFLYYLHWCLWVYFCDSVSKNSWNKEKYEFCDILWKKNTSFNYWMILYYTPTVSLWLEHIFVLLI